MADRGRLRRAVRALLFVWAALSLHAPAGTRAQPGGQPLPPEKVKATEEVLRLMTEATALQQRGEIDAAIKLRERAQEYAERDLGPNDFIVALNLSLLAHLYKSKGDTQRAEALYLRELEIREKVQGREHPEVATTLTSLGALYLGREEFARAEATLQRALAIQEKILGAEHPDVATTLYYLSATYSGRSDYTRAEPPLKRALAIQEKTRGTDSLYTAAALNNLAALYREKGDYGQAESLFLRALSIFEKLYGPEHPNVAPTLTNLAALYREKGDYLRAEPLLKRSLAVTEKSLGPEAENVANALNILAMLYSEKGDDERALPLFLRALAIREKVLGPASLSVAATLVSIAAVRADRGEYRPAVASYERAITILEQKSETTSPMYATALDNLGLAYALQGDTARAEPLVRKALSIRERVLGPEHPDVAVSLNTLAYLHFVKGEFDSEEPMYRRALLITEKSLGPDHPTVGTLLNNLATAYWQRGAVPQALDFLTRASELRERNLALILTTGSGEQKQRYAGTLSNETNANVSFHVQSAPDDGGAAGLAMTTVLRRKGRVLDAMTDQTAALRRRLNPEDRSLLDQLSAARSALARLTLSGADDKGRAVARREEMARLHTEVERLETEVSARSAEFRALEQPVTLKAVQDAVPADAALIEIVLYRPYDVKAARREARFGAARYVAYVLRRDGAPLWVDLGDAEKVDQEVAAWRRTLVDPTNKEVRERARSLDELVMRPVRKLLGRERHLLLSPDGALNLVPFGALVDERGRYLVEIFSITYLTSGRDLLRLRASPGSREPPVIVASPLFDGNAVDGPPAGTVQASQGRSAANSLGVHFSPLPGTRGEAAALGPLLPGVRVYTEGQATETALKRVSGPSVLHVATHGFFLPAQKPPGVHEGRALESRGLIVTAGASRQNEPGEEPMLRSGLALAGANRAQGSAGEDGILTALEAAGLDLWGTELVVLSACETGVGEVRNGAGVYGLRRALVLAGSESQVMSLWQVDDAATRDLMVMYYRRLQSGTGRTEALRVAQLEMLKSRERPAGQQGRGRELMSREGVMDRSHPFYWAAFIQSGEWKGMDGQGSVVRPRAGNRITSFRILRLKVVGR